MTEKEQIANYIDNYQNLQRIMTAEDPKKELQFQMKFVKAKLEAMGVPTENLEE